MSSVGSPVAETSRFCGTLRLIKAPVCRRPEIDRELQSETPDTKERSM
jgi:hypothetical protein